MCFVLRASGLDAEEFARASGYTDARGIRALLDDDELMDLELVDRIHVCYPMIDYFWLLTGYLREKPGPAGS